jgi:uncharacterized protein YaeQ
VERLHRASKSTPRVAVYTHKDPASLLRQLAGGRIHRREDIEIIALDRTLIAAMVERLERRMAFTLMLSEGHCYVTLGDETLEGAVTRLSLGGGPSA